MGRKLELVGGSSSLVEELKWSDSFVIQLLFRAREVEVGGIKPNLISNMVFLIVVLLLVILGFHPSGSFF